MLREILNKLEDPKIPLLGPNIRSLKFWGLLIPKNGCKKILKYLLNGLMILFVVTQYTDVWLVRTDVNFLLNNLKTSMVSTVNVFKVTMFFISQRKWSDLINYISKTDLRQRMTKHFINKKIISKNTNYCRKITYMYWLLTYFTAISLILQPISRYALSKTYRTNFKNGSEPYIELVRSWVPFDKTTMTGYLLASSYQVYATVMVAGYICSFDTIVIVTMVFFKTELMLLQHDCAKLHKFKKTDNDRDLSRLSSVHNRYVELVRFAELFNSCLSPIMFLYVFVCSVMLCASAYQITIESDTMQRFLTAEYLIFGVAQLFMYCWHSNEVLIESETLNMGPYNSSWCSLDVRYQKDIQLLGGQLNKTIIFRAGPFTNLTIATFISIIKGAYSYYTLIN